MSTSTATDEKPLVEVIRKLDPEKLLNFLKDQDLHLIPHHFVLFRNQNISGRAFLKLTKGDFFNIGLPLGPAVELDDLAEELRGKNLRSFSSYRSLKEVLGKYRLDGNSIKAIPLFKLVTYEIQVDNKHFIQCMSEILIRLRDYGSLLVDSLEIMRNEYVVAILHAAIHIVREITKKEISMRPQYEIVGEESTGRIDYTIKDSENLICITEDKHQIQASFVQNIKQLERSYETNKKKKADDDDFDFLYGIVTTGRDWHFLLYSPGEISQGSKLPLSIEFTDDALKENSEEYKALHKSVKRVLEVIVGLLKDKVCADKSPANKRTMIEKYRSKH